VVFEVTHPFHPHRGTRWALRTRQMNWGEIASFISMRRAVYARCSRHGQTWAKTMLSRKHRLDAHGSDRTIYCGYTLF
jgi:hypothetical protein